VGTAIDVETTDLIEEQVYRMEQNGVDVVVRGAPGYPPNLELHLGERSPPFLWFRGNSHLLPKLSVGFCGSRHASAIGLEVCGDIVQQLVQKGVVIVAGYAAGVDQLAHLTALNARGETVEVLAEGILNFSVRQFLAKEWDWNRAVVVSQFLPQKRWGISQAMQRNRTIFGLAKALVVIEARESGGTFEAGKEALSFKHPLFAPIYSSVEDNVIGNKILISRGAAPIMKSRSSGRAKIDSLLKSIDLESVNGVTANAEFKK